MKSYVTEGTGSEQTLLDSQDNKIPVYANEADLDDDLANLADGQIVATQDEGEEMLLPVDEVESGNLHAITSNAVAKALNYRRTEVKTGEKYYGESLSYDVYKQTFNVDMTSYTDTNDRRDFLGTFQLPNDTQTIIEFQGYFRFAEPTNIGVYGRRYAMFSNQLNIDLTAILTSGVYFDETTKMLNIRVQMNKNNFPITKIQGNYTVKYIKTSSI